MRKRILFAACVLAIAVAGVAYGRIRISVGYRDDKALRALKGESSWIMHRELDRNFRKWGSFYDDKKHLFSINVGGCADPSLPNGPEVWLPRFYGHGGWTGTRFIDLAVRDGKSLLTNAVPQFSKVEEGERGVLEIRYNPPEADVVMTLSANERDDKFFLTFELESRKPNKGYTVKLVCSPSSTGRFRKGPSRRARFIATSKREAGPAEKRVTLDTTAEPWVLCGDRIWDGTKAGDEKLPKDSPKGRKGMGPCALLFPPGEPSSATVEVTRLEIKFRLDYPPATRKIHLVFWQNFGDKDNKKALRYMKGLKFERAK